MKDDEGNAGKAGDQPSSATDLVTPATHSTPDVATPATSSPPGEAKSASATSPAPLSSEVDAVDAPTSIPGETARSDASRELPALREVVKNALSLEEQADWLQHLSTLPVSEKELIEIVDAKPSLGEKRRAIRRQLTIAKYSIQHWWRGGNAVGRVFYTAAWLFILISTAVKLTWPPLAIVLTVAGIVGAKIKFLWNDAHPKNMRLVVLGYNERKVAFARLLQLMQTWFVKPPEQGELSTFRQSALQLIADYVRDHRSRVGSRRISANLIVKDGDNAVVIARSDSLRPVPQRYTSKECALAWEVLNTGNPKVTGDLYEDFPDSLPGKKYRSILVLPVWFHGRVAAVVSVDSQEKYHFHLDFDDLQVRLAPYVQLIASALPDAHGK